MGSKSPFSAVFKAAPVQHARTVERAAGGRSALLKAVEEGQVQRIGGGYYGGANLEPSVAQVLVVARFFRRAVVSGISALQLHGLTDEYPNRVQIDIPRSSAARNKILEVRRVQPKFMIGIERREIHGVTVKLYDRERSLCDLYRMERDGARFLKSLKRYVASRKIDASKIAEYDKVLKTHVLSHLRQELADG